VSLPVDYLLPIVFITGLVSMQSAPAAVQLGAISKLRLNFEDFHGAYPLD